MGALTQEDAVTDRSVTRTTDLLHRLSDDDVQAAARRLPRAQQRALGQTLGVPASVLTDRPGSARVVRARTRNRRPADVTDVAHRLVDATWNAVVDALGDHASDPDEAQMRAAVESVLPEHGPGAVALVLALCADGDFVAAAVADTVLTGDPRLAPDAVGPLVDDESAPPGASTALSTDRASVDADAEAAKRAERRARKEAEKAARAQRGGGGPQRYKKSRGGGSAGPTPTAGPTAAPTADPTDVPPPVTVGGRPVGAATPRVVRPVGAHPDLDLDDALVGRIVLADIAFDDRTASKVRPCVVLAASGRSHLVVRTCSSEGGAVSRDWRSFPVGDLVAAGLDGPTYVSDDERRIPRTDVVEALGWLATADWNQL